MPLFEGFIGGAYRARSGNIAIEAAINVFPEITESANEQKHGSLYGTPGLKLLLAVTAKGCRGWFSQDGRTFVVVAGTLYEIDILGAVATSRGSIRDDTMPVSFSTNGRGGEQLIICGGGELKVLSLRTNVLSAAIVLPLTNAPLMIDFIDGYFVLSEADSIRVWFSALEDGTAWDALDFFAVSVTSSNVVGIKVLRDRVWVFQSQSSVVYYDSGDADNPFVPYPGSVMQEGAVTPWAITVQGESIYWLAQDDQGRNRIVSATNYAPVVISTPAVSYALAQYPTTTDCEVLAYEQEGHPFVIWQFQTDAWAYDSREQQWHQRQGWDQNAGTFVRWRARGVAAAGNVIVVGDYQNGNLYTLDLDTFQDNGAMIRRLRRAPYLSSDNQWMFLDRAELGMESGVGLNTGQGQAPVVMLTISQDSGHTYGPTTTATIGAEGAFDANAIWRRLGRCRADRLVVEVTQTDPVRTVWGPGLWLRSHAGSGQR